MTMRHIVFLFIVLFSAALSYQATTESTFFTSYIPRILFDHNFHSVVEGRFYRSGSMKGEELLRKIAQNRIRTVIDLRPSAQDSTAPASLEREMLEAYGIHYFNVPLVGSREPTRRELLPLLAAYDKAEEPILVHCSSGTHRSGVATVIWLLDKRGVPVDSALEQLTPRFGFIRPERQLKSWLTGKKTIDFLLWDFLEQRRRAPMSIRDWILTRTL